METLNGLNYLINHTSCLVDIKLILNNRIIKEDPLGEKTIFAFIKQVRFNNAIHLTKMADTMTSSRNQCKSITNEDAALFTQVFFEYFKSQHVKIKIFDTCIKNMSWLIKEELRRFSDNIEVYFKDRNQYRLIDLTRKKPKCMSVCPFADKCISAVDEYKVLEYFELLYLRIWSEKMVHEIALTIKPTMDCNMRCKHCFNGDNLKTSGLIDIKKVYNFIESACKTYSDVKVTFHGGEPTLAGYKFYDKVFMFQKQMIEKYNVKLSNNFTTNGLLLHDKLIDLLITNNALINISFDGPYNEFLRQNSNTVYNRICRVKAKGGAVRAFCTISKGSYKHLLDIYRWFNERKIDFKILPIEPRGYAAVDRELLMDTDQFIQVLTDAYKYWINDKKCCIRFYTFEEFASLRRKTQFKSFWFNREIALNPDGNIYPFGRPNDIQFCLGEPTDRLNITKCFSSNEYSRMLEILTQLRSKYCTNCPSSQVCNGVCICMSYMYVQNDELLRYSCNKSNRIFKSILAVNDEVIDDFRYGNTEKYNTVIINKFVKEYGGD